MTEQRIRKLRRQLQESRYRLCHLYPGFAAPLREMIYVATTQVKKISTNGQCIYFDPNWFQKLGNRETDFILLHQLSHIALGHINRPMYYIGDRFHLACDIVANSHLRALGWNYERLPGIGRILTWTFHPTIEGSQLTAEEALGCIPFDPAKMKPEIRRNYMIDSEEWWDRKEDRGELGVIVLSPADRDPEDLQAEDNTGGTNVYVPKQLMPLKPAMGGGGKESTGKSVRISWERRVSNELFHIRSENTGNPEVGRGEEYEARVWHRVQNSKLNWKKILASFVQEELCDYSFTPPDRRLQDLDFFLPEYTVLLEKPKEILFMVDTSASVEDEVLSEVYGEICSAIAQFDGGMKGVLCFFDEHVYSPTAFSDISDLKRVQPIGGGGTNYECIFHYIKRHEGEGNMASVVIFTDGVADFPPEPSIDSIPVLWLISNSEVTPPWGKVGRVLR